MKRGICHGWPQELWLRVPFADLVCPGPGDELFLGFSHPVARHTPRNCRRIQRSYCSLQPHFPKPKLTAEQFAGALERHLLGKDDGEEWDNLSYSAFTEERLKQIQWELWRFDSLSTEKDKQQLKALISAIRSGSLPEVVPPTQLTDRWR